MFFRVLDVCILFAIVNLTWGQTPAEPPLASPPSGLPSRGPDQAKNPAEPQPGVIEPGLEAQGTYNPQDPPVPVVTVRVRVPASVSPGGEAVYKIHVDNVSGAMAHRVRVRNLIPSNTKYVSADPKPESDGQELVWLFGTMKAGEQRVITMVLQADGKGDIENTARVSFEHGQTTKTRVASAMRIEKRAPERAMVLDSWTYTIDVSNTGTSPVGDIVISDTIPDGLDFLTSNPSTKGENPLLWNIGKLDPGQTRRIEYQVAAKKAGEYSSMAKLSAAGGLSREAFCRTVVGESKLKMYKSGPDRRAVGRPATYHITLENEGNNQIRNIRITSKVDASFVMLAASGGGRLIGGEVVWDIPYIEPDQRKTFQLVVRATKPGELRSRAECVAERLGQGIQAEKTTVFEQRNDLVLEIDKTVDPVEVGELATYTIKLINLGQIAINSPFLQLNLPGDWKNASGRGAGIIATQIGTNLNFGGLSSIEPGRELQFQITAAPMSASKGQLKAEILVGGSAVSASIESVQILPSQQPKLMR